MVKKNKNKHKEENKSAEHTFKSDKDILSVDQSQENLHSDSEKNLISKDIKKDCTEIQLSKINESQDNNKNSEIQKESLNNDNFHINNEKNDEKNQYKQSEKDSEDFIEKQEELNECDDLKKNSKAHEKMEQPSSDDKLHKIDNDTKSAINSEAKNKDINKAKNNDNIDNKHISQSNDQHKDENLAVRGPSTEEEKCQNNDNGNNNLENNIKFTEKPSNDKLSDISNAQYKTCESHKEELGENLRNNLLAKNQINSDQTNILTREANEMLGSELFRLSRNDNANKLRKEILKIQNRADKYVEKLYSISKDFLAVKQKLHDRYNSLYTSLLVFFGFHYRINFKRSNFFILATQAYIVEVFRLLEDFIKKNVKILNPETDPKLIMYENSQIKLIDIQDRFNIENTIEQEPKDQEKILIDYPNNITFANILKKIVSLKIDEEEYLYNLSILTGSIYTQSYSSSTTKLIERNIANLYFNALNHVLKNFEFGEAHEDEELDQRKFENLMMDLFRKAVERALNIMENQSGEEKGSDWISYIENFNKLQETCKDTKLKKLSYNKYLKILFDNNKQKDFSNKSSNLSLYSGSNYNFSLKICAESFFNFSLFKFDEIVDDIRFIITEFKSLHFRIRCILGATITRIIDFNKMSISLVKALLAKMMKELKTKIRVKSDAVDKLYEYYHKKYPKTFKVLDDKIYSVVQTSTNFKQWINSSCNSIKSKGYQLYEKQILDNYRLVYNQLFYPVMDFTFRNSKIMGDYVFVKASNCKNCLNNYRKIILEAVLENRKAMSRKIHLTYNTVSERLHLKKRIDYLIRANDKALVQYEESEDKTYVILKINKNIIGNIFGTIKKFRTSTKSYLVQSYTNFLKNLSASLFDFINYSIERKNNVYDYITSQYREIVENES